MTGELYTIDVRHGRQVQSIAITKTHVHVCYIRISLVFLYDCNWSTIYSTWLSINVLKSHYISIVVFHDLAYYFISSRKCFKWYMGLLKAFQNVGAWSAMRVSQRTILEILNSLRLVSFYIQTNNLTIHSIHMHMCACIGPLKPYTIWSTSLY